jgi:hypothetical protein
MAILALLALGVAVFFGTAIHRSGAVFVDASHNPGNLFAAGSMRLTNSKDAQAVIDVTGLALGASASGTLTIGTTGDYNTQVTLNGSGDTGALAQTLLLTVEYLPAVGAAQTLWSGGLNSLGTLPLGTFAPGVSKNYRFTVTLPANAPLAALNSTTAETLTFTGVVQ